MKTYKLNTVVGNYKIGDEVTAEEISKFLNIQQCIKCGWLKEVQPKSNVWEIVALKNWNGHLNSSSYVINAFLNNEPAKDGYYIHSVKRLRDGVIFSLGDWYEGGMERGRINSFNINEGGAIFLNSNPTQKFGLNISVAKLVAKPSGLGSIFSQRIGKGEAFIGPASLAEHPMCKKDELPKTGLAIDISKGSIDEAKLLGVLWEKFQPTVLQPRRMPLPEDFIFPKEISLLFQDGKKVKLSDVVHDFLKSFRPPIGIIPEWLWKEHRLEEIRKALIRFNEHYNSRKEAPKEWLDEKHSLEKWLTENTRLPKEDKNWQILEFVTPFLGSNGVHFTRNNSGNFCTGLNGGIFEYTEERMLEEERPIYSVRRISDNQIFNVAEIYKDNMGREMKPVKKFFIKEGVMYAQFDEGRGVNDGCLGINSLQKNVVERRVKNMQAHNLSAEGVTIKAIVRGDVTDTDLKKINQAIEGILSKKKK